MLLDPEAEQNEETIFRLIQKHFSGTFRKIQPHIMSRTAAKVGKQKSARKKHNLPIDRFSEKQPRGRPRKIQPSWVRGRADNYRQVFDLFWQHVWPNLSKATTQQDVIQSFSRPETTRRIKSASLMRSSAYEPTCGTQTFPSVSAKHKSIFSLIQSPLMGC